MAARVPARPRRFARWARVHRWLGLALGLWFALVGLTGALLVWRDELDAWLNPQWFTARAAGAPLPLEQIVHRARAEHGLGRLERIRPPQRAGEVWRLQVRAGASRVESGRLEAFIDPADGSLLGTRGLESRSLQRADAMRLLYDFHRNLLLGEPGSNAVGLAGMLLLTSVVTGLVIAWPRSREHWHRLLRVTWGASATRVAFDLHRSAGVLVATVLLLSTLTGATLVYTNYVRELVSLVSRVEPFPVLPWRDASLAPALGLDELSTRVQAAFPAHRIAEIRLSERSQTGVLFQLRAPGDVHRLGDTIVWVHPTSGEMLAERSDRTRSAGELFMHWLLPLHVGSAAGTPGLWTMCAAGLAPLLLVGTGLWVWWRKRPGERTARERAARRAAGNTGGHAA